MQTSHTRVAASRKWVAARLWDWPLADSTDPSASLRMWVDRWNQLGCPSLVPGLAWNETAANAFREAALNVLELDPGFFHKQVCIKDIHVTHLDSGVLMI